ncbi:N-acetylmuramoyl-L-alanine amidase [Paenibacillus ginsengarvi]|uniref:N-acetylmuramoyl-L-alanine amidase n=1 Tax=Paenibacillus ginsengarvi TaxID=400777 RepID=A0A3B0CHM9_9BACL|nr:N-acetylmuramoyl-L-alanine amidase [Paenibacillus ginsengarvi]RKN83859.1 N-acetylmuramoyl-L-alanine amidase [Paenibacillus ginsengarvi]
MRDFYTGLIKLLLAAVFLVAAPAKALAEKIVVDAGHGGSDPGAIGVNGLYEKNVNYNIAQKLRDLLAGMGYDVVLTRKADEYISLADRVAMTDEAKPSLFVSVHANSHPNANVSGAMVLYYDKDYPQDSYPASDAMTALTPESKKLAELVQQSIVKQTGFADKGLLPSAAYVIRMGQVPSILVETAFLSNSGDAARLANDTVRQQLAQAVANGIAAYLPLTKAAFSDISRHWAQSAITRLKEKGLVEGSGGRFEPDKPMTRAEWLTIADRLFHFSDKQQTKSGLSVQVAAQATSSTVTAQVYKDLPQTHWSYKTMQAAIGLGYVGGYEDGSIRPDQPVTRAEVAVLLERMTGAISDAPWKAAADFKDVPASYWAAGSIYRLKQKGIMEGITEATFSPGKSMTRAEMAAMIDRYVAKTAP